MASLVGQIRTLLVADPDVAALVGDRVYAVKAPPETEKPYVVLGVVSDVPESTLDTETLSNARVQATSWAARYEEAHEIAAAVGAVIAALRTPSPGLSAWKASGPTDLHDSEAELHGATSDFSVWR